MSSSSVGGFGRDLLEGDARGLLSDDEACSGLCPHGLPHLEAVEAKAHGVKAVMMTALRPGAR